MALFEFLQEPEAVDSTNVVVHRLQHRHFQTRKAEEAVAAHRAVAQPVAVADSADRPCVGAAEGQQAHLVPGKQPQAASVHRAPREPTDVVWQVKDAVAA